MQREAGGAAVVQDVLRLADRNGDGVLDRREWVRAYAAINELLRDEEGGSTRHGSSEGNVAAPEGPTRAARGSGGRALQSTSSSISDLFQPDDETDENGA